MTRGSAVTSLAAAFVAGVGVVALRPPHRKGELSNADLLRLLEASESSGPLLSSAARPSQADADRSDVDAASGTSSLIPRRIYQTMHIKEPLPPAIAGATQAWRQLNPEYEYEIHDAMDARELIVQEFHESFVEIFDSLGQYQQKSDLWRLCILFLKGGVYVDADYAALAPLRSFVPDDARLVVALSAPVVIDPLQPPLGCHTRAEALRRLQNGFIAVEPRHPLLFLALQKLRLNFYLRADQHYLLAMGPALLYEAPWLASLARTLRWLH
eukprot:TRINITY_DN19062_c0_g1_i1.p1 TRINITY_DN19062_c0_g1~~TRINITY_DN19062_c0_g1_i1.p1  ORF type:complete len:291 (-),score=59.19 TRINITY_DN19062_c0_g1_i1:121-930(-)